MCPVYFPINRLHYKDIPLHKLPLFYVFLPVVFILVLVSTLSCGIRVGTVNFVQGEAKNESDVDQHKNVTTDTEATIPFVE